MLHACNPSILEPECVVTSQRSSWENRKDFTSEFEKQNVRAGEVAGGKEHLLSTQETLGVPNAQTQTTEKVGSL